MHWLAELVLEAKQGVVGAVYTFLRRRTAQHMPLLRTQVAFLTVCCLLLFNLFSLKCMPHAFVLVLCTEIGFGCVLAGPLCLHARTMDRACAVCCSNCALGSCRLLLEAKLLARALGMKAWMGPFYRLGGRRGRSDGWVRKRSTRLSMGPVSKEKRVLV